MRQKIKSLLEQETGGGQEKTPSRAMLKVRINGKIRCQTQKAEHKSGSESPLKTQNAPIIPIGIKATF